MSEISIVHTLLLNVVLARSQALFITLQCYESFLILMIFSLFLEDFVCYYIDTFPHRDGLALDNLLSAINYKILYQFLDL